MILDDFHEVAIGEKHDGFYVHSCSNNLCFFLYEINAHWTTIWRLSSSQRYPSLIHWFRKSKYSYPWMWWLSLTFEIWRTTKLASSHDTKLWHPYWKQDKDSSSFACKTSFNPMQVDLPLKYNTNGSIDYFKTHLAQHKDFIKLQVLILTKCFSCCQTWIYTNIYCYLYFTLTLYLFSTWGPRQKDWHA